MAKLKTTPDYLRLLDSESLGRLQRLELIARGVVEGFVPGKHRSPYKGFSVEFAEHRQYVPGDDIADLDWRVLARSDRYYVRLFEAERNLLSYLVVDTSGSMAYRGEVVQTDSKLVYASRLAAAIGYLVIREGDEVGLSLATNRIHDHEMPRGTWPRAACPCLA